MLERQFVDVAIDWARAAEGPFGVNRPHAALVCAECVGGLRDAEGGFGVKRARIAGLTCGILFAGPSLVARCPREVQIPLDAVVVAAVGRAREFVVGIDGAQVAFLDLLPMLVDHHGVPVAGLALWFAQLAG